MPYIRYMGGRQTPPTTNFKPTDLIPMINTFPYSTPTQLITNFANSAKNVADICDRTGPNRNECRNYFAQRVHELMHYRSHTVNTD